MKSCVLFSGGWDSVAVALKLPINVDLLFFDYGQIYKKNELDIATKFANQRGQYLRFQKLNLKHDIERRNFYFILEAKRLGYETIYSGSRNIIPLLDKYKDSNWLSLKIFAYLCNIKINLPIVGWDKSKIVKYVKSKTNIIPYNCYKNKNEIMSCDCENCQELKLIGIS